MTNAPLAEKIAGGALVRKSGQSVRFAEQAAEICARFEAEGVETVRLLFPDQHGLLRGKTVVPAALPGIFAAGIGMPSTLLLKDTAHKTVFPVWDGAVDFGGLAFAGAADMLALPDPRNVWTPATAPHSRLLLCDLHDRAGATIPVAPRAVLGRAEAQLADAGFRAVMGLEVEFQLFRLRDPRLDHAAATMPPRAPETENTTQGWQYLTEDRYAAMEPALDTLRRAAEAMELGVRSVEVEMGPSQFEFTFAPADPATQADRYVLFRSMVKAVAAREGLHASFMSKPRLPGAAANGWHLHQSLLDPEGTNAFMPGPDGALTDTTAGWIAGLLEHAAASCLLTTPTVNGYKRYVPGQLAPNRVTWGYDNRGAMLRALLAPGDPASRIENRVPEAAACPHYAMAAQILAGTDGLARGAVPPAPTATPYATDAETLPTDLGAAIAAFEASALFRERLGPDVVRYLAQIKRAEWQRYLATISDWEHDEYFGLF